MYHRVIICTQDIKDAQFIILPGLWHALSRLSERGEIMWILLVFSWASTMAPNEIF